MMMNKESAAIATKTLHNAARNEPHGAGISVISRALRDVALVDVVHRANSIHFLLPSFSIASLFSSTTATMADQLATKYASQLQQLSAIFPDWDEQDLLFTLQDVKGNLEEAAVMITEG